MEAAHPATVPEDSGNSFTEALRDTADDVWADYDAAPPDEPKEDDDDE